MTLSPRQLEIVTLIGRDDYRWQDVADELGISLATVRTHTDRIIARNPTEKSPRGALTELYWSVVRSGDNGKAD